MAVDAYSRTLGRREDGGYERLRKTERFADRYSTVLGHPCSIMQPLGTPKRPEECQPFTFSLDGNHVRGQEQFTKKLATLTRQQAKRAKARERAAAKRS